MTLEGFKIFVKNKLSRIPFKWLYIILVGLCVVGILGGNMFSGLGNSMSGGVVWNVILLVGVIPLCVLIVLHTIVQVINQIESVLAVIAFIIWTIFMIIFLGKAVVYFVPKFFPRDSVEPIINLFSSCFSAIVSAFIGILGVFLGANQQKDYEKQIKLKEMQAKEKNLEKLFSTFIKQEITYNFNVALANSREFFKKQNSTLSYEYSKFIFQEFDAIKSELISLDCEISKTIIEIYSMFKILQYNKDIKNLTKEQYTFVREVYLKYIDEYSKGA